MRIMRSGVMCLGNAAAICDLCFSSNALTVVSTCGLLGGATCVDMKSHLLPARTVDWLKKRMPGTWSVLRVARANWLMATSFGITRFTLALSVAIAFTRSLSEMTSPFQFVAVVMPRAAWNAGTVCGFTSGKG